MFKITTPVLPSLNEAETISFYKEKLGFEFISSHNGYLIFSRDGLRIHLWPCADAEQGKNAGCYIYVTAIDELYAEYQQQEIIHPNGFIEVMPWSLRQFAVVDNNNNIFYFAEYKSVQ